MTTREWRRIEREADLDAFLVWLLDQPEDAQWRRGNSCACPLHDFIEAVTGHSLNVNSPELEEHWAERETQSWPTPWWMTWMMRSIDYTADDSHMKQEGYIRRDEVLALALIMIRRDFFTPVMTRSEMLEAA